MVRSPFTLFLFRMIFVVCFIMLLCYDMNITSIFIYFDPSIEYTQPMGNRFWIHALIIVCRYMSILHFALLALSGRPVVSGDYFAARD